MDEELLSRSQVRDFGDYELLEEIARGGMGVVYRARQRSLKRPVAVKMILAGELASPAAVQRFRLEAQAAAKLDHPHIVPIYEVGERNEQHYFAMKLVEGGSLAGRISEFRIQNSDSRAGSQERQRVIAGLLVKVADALAYAHAHGVLHRDVKPNNILLDRGDEPLLTDFGLAKLTAGSSGPTLSSSVLGSPSYMAPEQATGNTSVVTTAVDVYGLGAVLYELLTGRPPFVGETAIATLRKVLDEEVEPVTRLAPTVHPDLATICHRCLAKEPGARYRSASAVADELQRFLRGEPIEARPVSAGERFWRWCKRRPAIAGLGATAIVATLVGLAGVLWQWRRAENSQKETQQANQQLRRTLGHLEWRGINSLLEQDYAGRAVAHLADRLRHEPTNWQAATYAISILEQRAFPMPAGPELVYSNGVAALPAISPDGARVAIAGRDRRVRLHDAVTAKEVVVLAPEADVTSLAYSPDGALLAMATRDGGLDFFEARSGTSRGRVATQANPLRELVFSQDGQTVAVAGGTVAEIWRVTNALAGGAPLATLQHSFPVGRVRLTRDGGRLLTWGTQINQRLTVWDAATGAKLFQPPQRGEVRGAALDAKGERVAAITGEYEATVWDTASGRALSVVADHSSPVEYLALTPDGERVVLGFRSGAVQVFSVMTGMPASELMGHQYFLNSLALDDEGRRIVTGARDYKARVWDVASGASLCEPMPLGGPVMTAGFAARAGRVLALSSESGRAVRRVSVWNLRRPVEPLRFQPPGARDLNAVRLSRDGKLVVVGAWSPARAISVYDVASQQLVFGPAAIRGDAYAIEFTPDMKRLIVATASGWLHGWSVGDWRPLWEPVRTPGAIQPAVMSPDGTFFATSGPDGFVRLWYIETGRLLREMKQSAYVKGLRLSPDGTRLLAGSTDGIGVIWDVQTGTRLTTLKGHTAEILSVAFSPDGRRAATASYDSTVRLWNAETGGSIASPLRHQGDASHVAFSPDGRKVATAARDGTARIWDALTGKPLVDWMRHEATVQTVEFHPDGRRFLTRDHAGFRLWDAETGEPVTVHYRYPVTSGLGLDSPTLRETFSRDGRKVFLGGSTDDAVLWHIPDPPSGVPAWFPDLLEAVAGQRLGEAGEYLPVPAEVFLELRARAATFGEKGYYENWARWYLSLAPLRPE